MIKALIFDFDGTIVDTESLWFEVCQGQFAKHGFHLDLATYCRCVGASLADYDPYLDLATRLGQPDLAPTLEAAARDEYRSREAQLALRDGVQALIALAAAQGLALAVASSSDYEHVSSYLQRFSLMAYFPVICTRNDVARVKPAPDLFELALSRLGVSANEAVVFEDSPNGLLAAAAAGITTVIVANQLTAALNFTDHARVKVTSFVGLDLKGIVDELATTN